MKRWTKDSLVKAGVKWAEDNQSWPTWTDNPASEATIRRLLKTFDEYDYLVRKAYTSKHGVPSWDVTIKTAPKTRALVDHLTLVVKNNLDRVAALPPHKPRLRKHKLKGSPSELHVVISDVHVGEKTEITLTAGMSEYNYSTFEKRADLMESKLFFFRDMYEHAFPIRKLVIHFLGDIITGEAIFAGQQLEIDQTVSQQIIAAHDRFAKMFTAWAAAFEEVEVFCIPGNHGRVGRKTDGFHYLTNFEHQMYHFMARELRGIENLTMRIATGPSMIVERGNFNFLLCHGDSLPGAAASRGNYQGLEKRLRAFSAMANVPLHIMVCGHFHRSGSLSTAGGGRIIVNGSWPGASMFSVETVGDGQVPCQKLFLFHPDKGIHSETDLILGDRVTLTPDEAGVMSRNWVTA